LRDERPRKEPLILEIKGNSLDDGPGIRTVVFFKGCPLDCTWCHNPESKRAGAEMSFDEKECVACDACIEACGLGALSRDLPGFINRERCDMCLECVEACPSKALALVGRRMSVEQVAGEIEKDLPFFRTSGGGATLSGGEPTLFMDYCSRLLSRLEEAGIHTIVETCGFFDLEGFERLVLPHTDSVYYDLKVFDESLHREHCGVSNTLILANFEALLERCATLGKELLPRVPLVPGITATDENLKAIAGFLNRCGAKRVALMQYNPLWLDKSRKLGRATGFSGQADKESWMASKDIDACRAAMGDLEVV
jgi:pyruvate formate lyase activating enzyme